MEEVPWSDAEVFLGGEQLPQLAILVVLAANERDLAAALALAEEVVEKLRGFLSAPILAAAELRKVDEVNVLSVISRPFALSAIRNPLQ